MGKARFSDFNKFRKVMYQKTKASQDLAAEVDRIMKLPAPGKKNPPKDDKPPTPAEPPQP